MLFILTGNSLNDNDDDSVSSLVIDTNSNVDKEKAQIEAIFVSSVTTKLRSLLLVWVIDTKCDLRGVQLGEGEGFSLLM